MNIILYIAPGKKLSSRATIINEKDKIDAVKSLLTDSASVSIFNSIISFYEYKHSRVQRSKSPQYYEKSLIDMRLIRNMVICGGYDETSIINADREAFRISKLFVFEPCNENYNNIIKHTPFLDSIDNLIALPIAVGRELSSGYLQKVNKQLFKL